MILSCCFQRFMGSCQLEMVMVMGIQEIVPQVDIQPAQSERVFTGLNSAEVKDLRKQYGENVLPEEKRISPWKIFFNQLKSPLVYIILVAAGVSLAVGEMGDFVIIMAVVVIDAILGFIQEYQAQKTYTALKGLLKPMTTVIRDGLRQEIEVRELVPGDLVVLNAGEHIPGDGELIESSKLSVDEAILTGESEPVNKSVSFDDQSIQRSRLFMGATVVTGHGMMVVNQTGMDTELGKIATSLGEHEEEDTPLQVRLKAFSKSLTIIVIVFTVAILITGLVIGKPFLDMLRTSIILAIAAVPEGLLIAVTVILVLGMRKILKRNGLVKQMLAVVTLGSVTTICTDKTGTLTEGRMRVTKSDLLDEERALETMVLCNNLEGPVDIALWEFAKFTMKTDPQDLFNSSPRLAEELFTSETKYMITAVTNTVSNGERVYYLKGAPEIVLDMCRISPRARNSLLALVDQWAGEGLRLLGLAYRPIGTLEDYTGYTWVGLLGMEDPVREGVQEAIQAAQKAGIRVKMVTGDYRRTAEKIAGTIGLVVPSELHSTVAVMDGAELVESTDENFQDMVNNITVFSRIRPSDKLRIVHALQQQGEITAMIGDGVNDAPALQRANIGVVVSNATDVAKETADLILLDSNFKTIVAAIEEGRTIFANIQKVVAYVLSNSFAEVLTIFMAMVLKLPPPLAVAQILWIHLICDGPSDIVLGFEPKEEGIMEEKPKSIKEPILTRLGLSLIATISITSALAALLIFGYYYQIHGDAVEGQSLVFASFAVNSMIYIFAYRSMRRPLWRMPPLSQNKPLIWAVLAGLFMVAIAFIIPQLRDLLGIVPLSWGQWGLITMIAFGMLGIVEISKAISKRYHKA
jgi:P-type Ca2+ transporter type 2C